MKLISQTLKMGHEKDFSGSMCTSLTMIHEPDSQGKEKH